MFPGAGVSTGAREPLSTPVSAHVLRPHMKRKTEGGGDGRGRLLVRGLSDLSQVSSALSALACMATHTYWAGKSPPGSSAARTQRRVNRPLPYNPATHGGAGRTGLRRRPEQQTQHAGERRPRDAADAGGRGTRRTHAPLGSTLGSLAVGELRGDSWRFVEILEPRSTLASLAVGRWRRAGSATSLVRQSGVHNRTPPVSQPMSSPSALVRRIPTGMARHLTR